MKVTLRVVTTVTFVETVPVDAEDQESLVHAMNKARQTPANEKQIIRRYLQSGNYHSHRMVSSLREHQEITHVS